MDTGEKLLDFAFPVSRIMFSEIQQILPHETSDGDSSGHRTKLKVVHGCSWMQVPKTQSDSRPFICRGCQPYEAFGRPLIRSSGSFVPSVPSSPPSPPSPASNVTTNRACSYLWPCRDAVGVGLMKLFIEASRSCHIQTEPLSNSVGGIAICYHMAELLQILLPLGHPTSQSRCASTASRRCPNRASAGFPSVFISLPPLNYRVLMPQISRMMELIKHGHGDQICTT